MPLLIFPILLVCTLFGYRTARPWLVASSSAAFRFLAASTIGLVVLSYAMLALGVVGAFTLPATATVLAAMALVGLPNLREPLADAKHIARSVRSMSALEKWILFSTVPFFAVMLLGAFVPPTEFISGINYTEWDSLTYHLADPKIFLRAHRIISLPWEDHSNFPFSAEMWYAIGLMLGSVPLSKLFHLWCAVITAGGTYCLARICVDRRAALIAMLLCTSVPLVFWEGGTAYIDLALTGFGALSLRAVLEHGENRRMDVQVLAALLTGCALATKTLGLVHCGLLACAVALYAWRNARSLPIVLKQTAAFAALALAAGAPWYLKSWCFSGNPVYPFAYQIFGGHPWSAAEASLLTSMALAFGLGRSLTDWLLLPWNVTMYPLDGHPAAAYFNLSRQAARHPENLLPFNYYPSVLNCLPPAFLIGTFFVGTLRKKLAMWVLLAYSVVFAAFWFLTAQYIRYLLPIVPPLCVLTAVAAQGAWRWKGPARWCLPLGIAASLVFSLATVGQLAAAIGPVAVGTESQSAFLARTGRSNAVITAINAASGPRDCVAMYGHTFGFRLNVPYFWGEPGHGEFVPYKQFSSAGELRSWLLRHNVRWIILNSKSFPTNAGDGYAELVDALTTQRSAPDFRSGSVAAWDITKDTAATPRS